MALVFTQTNGSALYTVDSGFDLHNIPGDRGFKVRSKLTQRFGIAGGYNTGDKAVQAREVRVKGAFHAANANALNLFLNNLSTALENNGNPFKFSWESNWTILCESGELKVDRFEGGLAYKSVNLEFTLLAAEPYWRYATDNSVGPTSITTSPQNIVLANNGNVAAPLVVTLAPTAAWASVIVENVTDDGNLCRYVDGSLQSGSTAIINAHTGTVTRDGVNTLRHFYGSFLRVLPGNNTIRITCATGGAVTLTAPLYKL